MLTLGSYFWLARPDDLIGGSLVAYWLTAMSVLVAIFSGQGPTNFLAQFRELVLSSTDFREALIGIYTWWFI